MGEPDPDRTLSGGLLEDEEEEFARPVSRLSDSGAIGGTPSIPFQVPQSGFGMSLLSNEAVARIGNDGSAAAVTGGEFVFNAPTAFSESGDKESDQKVGNTTRRMSTRISINAVKGLMTSLVEEEPKRLSRAVSKSIDNLSSAVAQLEGSFAESQAKNTKDIYGKVNKCIKAVASRVDMCLPMVAALESFPIRDGKTALRPFTGDGEEDWTLWLRRFNDLVNMASTRLTDAQKAAHLIGNLAGRARDAVDTLNDGERAVYATVVERVVSLIRCPEERAMARQRLCTCRQEAGESVQEFFSRLQRIVRSAMHGRDADVVSERTLEEFVDRLNPKISFHVKAQVPNTVDDALKLAKRYESLLTDMASTMLAHGLIPDVQASQVQAPAQTVAPPAATASSSNQQQGSDTSFRKGIVCYGCGIEGHFKRDCTMPPPPYQGQQGGQWRGGRGGNRGRGRFSKGFRGNNRQGQSNGNYNQNQYGQMIPFQGQPMSYYPAPSHYPSAQQPVQMVHQVPTFQFQQPQPPMMMMPTPMPQHVPSTTQQVMSGQVPSTCSLIAPSADGSKADLERKVSKLQNELDAAKRRSEALLERHNEMMERTSSTGGARLPLKNAALVACLFALFAGASAQSVAPLYFCPEDAHSTFWDLPGSFNCSLFSDNGASEPEPLEISIYRVNTARYESRAHLCKMVTETVEYERGVFGGKFIKGKTIESLTVSSEQCRLMIDHHKCKHGALQKRGHVWTTGKELKLEWPVWPFAMFGDAVTITNCILIESTVYARHGPSPPDCPVADISSCHYNEEHCTLEDGGLVLWKADSMEKYLTTHRSLPSHMEPMEDDRPLSTTSAMDQESPLSPSSVIPVAPLPETLSEPVGKDLAPVGKEDEEMLLDGDVKSPPSVRSAALLLAEEGETGQSPNPASTLEENSCSLQGGCVDGKEAVPASRASAGTLEADGCPLPGGSAGAASTTAKTRTNPNKLEKASASDSKEFKVVVNKRGTKRPYPSWANLLYCRRHLPEGSEEMEVHNGSKGHAPSYYAERWTILNPYNIVPNDSNSYPPPKTRELVNMDMVEEFRDRTDAIIRSNATRPYRVVSNEQLPEVNSTQKLPLRRDGVLPILYRMTPFLKGKGRYLEAVHFEVFLDGRADLRVILLDNFTQNVDGSNIQLDGVVPGDLYWVYTVALATQKARTAVIKGGIDVNAMLDDTNFSAQWAAELVAPLPLTDNFIRLCLSKRTLRNGVSLMIVPGNPEFSSIRKGFPPSSYIDAVVRKNEGGWVFPVEVVHRGCMAQYLKKVGHVRSLYRTCGPFVVSAVAATEDYLQKLNDRISDFSLYSSDKEESQKVLADTVALGVAIRAHSEVASKRLSFKQVTVTGASCELPFPPVVTIEIVDLKYSFDQLDRITLHTFGFQPGMVVHPKSVETADEKEKLFCVVGTIDFGSFAKLCDFLGKTNADPNDFSLKYEAGVYPRAKMLDGISELTSSAQVGVARGEEEGQHLDLLYGKAAPQQLSSPPAELVSVARVQGGPVTLNQKQSHAVLEVVEGRRTLIVRSPPGSGKTFVAAVMALRVSNDEHVLMCAITNSAVKNMADTLVGIQQPEGKRAIRVVSAAASSRMSAEDKSPIDLDERLPDLMEETLDYIAVEPHDRVVALSYLERHKTLKALAEAVANASGPERVEALDRYNDEFNVMNRILPRARKIALAYHVPNIVIQTIDSAVQSPVHEIDVLIIDEASQVTEAQLLCLIARYPKANIVLIGDPQQLDPFKYENKDHQNLAGRSALLVAERNSGYAVVQLDKVYRAPPSLTSLYSDSFYAGSLVPDRDEAPLNILERARLVPSGSFPYALFDTAGLKIERNASHSLRNKGEGRLALEVIDRLIDVGVSQKDILVVCFYAFQQSFLRNIFTGRRLSVEVLTVDSAQGRERSVVLLLTTRVKGGRATFFEDAKRVNVAISRQQDALIVFGNPQVLRDLDSWRTLVRRMEENDAVRRKVEWAEPSDTQPGSAN